MALNTDGVQLVRPFDPLDSLKSTATSNALLYGVFPIGLIDRFDGEPPRPVVRQGKDKTGTPLSKQARHTYQVLDSLDWDCKDSVWYTWDKLCELADTSRRTMAEHLEELEASGLLAREARRPDQRGGTKYNFTGLPIKEVWRSLMLKVRNTGRPHLPPHIPQVLLFGGKQPINRDEFNEAFEKDWWPSNGEKLEEQHAQLLIAMFGRGRWRK